MSNFIFFPHLWLSALIQHSEPAIYAFSSWLLPVHVGQVLQLPLGSSLTRLNTWASFYSDLILGMSLAVRRGGGQICDRYALSCKTEVSTSSSSTESISLQQGGGDQCRRPGVIRRSEVPDVHMRPPMTQDLVSSWPDAGFTLSRRTCLLWGFTTLWFILGLVPQLFLL